MSIAGNVRLRSERQDDDLVPVDDVPALAQAMERLFGAPELRSRYAAAARNLVVEKFAADIIGRQIVQLYRQCLAHKRMSERQI